MNPMVRAFWRLAHRLPWSVTRHFCDMCAEFPFDPRKGFPAGSEVRLTERRPIGWSCEHLTITSPNLLGKPKAWCGCEMTPLVVNR